MAKIMVCQHVPYEPLGTLDPLLRAQKHRIRYVNFGRTPLAKPSIAGYDALILLGGPMNIGQEAVYPHLNEEKALILQAHQMGIPVLGICLGAQLIASAFGASVSKAETAEIGWYPLHLTPQGEKDPVLHHLASDSKVFQWHGFTFDFPKQSTALATGTVCQNQAFRIDDAIYGFQYHLEASLSLIKRWLHLPQHQEELGDEAATQKIESIWKDTLYNIDDSIHLSRQVFSSFLDQLPKVNQLHYFAHR